MSDKRMEYADYLKSIFGKGKVQKISVNAGMSCPNRDGTLGIGGCIYCNNESFSPAYCMNTESDVSAQLREGISFFSRKYPEMRYLAYFQSFSNTYGRSVEELRQMYEEALRCQGVVGLVIGTRPDTLSEDVLALLQEINGRVPVIMELGAESSDDATLRLINRGHTWADTVNAVQRINRRGLRCGLHLIAGLPSETRQRSLQSVRDAVGLPIDTIKLHQLQILRRTRLHQLWLDNAISVTPFELEEYIEFCKEVIRIVPRHIVIERFLAQAPPEMVVAPRWGIKNYQFKNLLEKSILGR